MNKINTHCPTCGQLILNSSKVEDIMNKLKVLGEVSIRHSEYTGKFYVHMEPMLEIGDGHFLCGAIEHRETPDEAIKAYFNRITNLEWYEFLVIDAWGNNGKEYKYIDGEFKRI